MIFFANIMLFTIVFWVVLSKLPVRLRTRIYSFAVCLILFILMAFKSSNVGNDTSVYIALFNQLKATINLIDNPTRYEIGYVIYSKIIAIIFGDYQYLFIITSLIVVICIRIFILKNSSLIWMSFYMLISLRLYYFFLSGLRQTIAVSIICISYLFIKERKLIKFILLVLLATMFHNTAIIFLIAYPISFFKFNKKGVAVIGLGTVLIYIIFNNVISLVFKFVPAYYSHYQFTAQFSENNLANYINSSVIFTFFLLGIVYRYWKQGEDFNSREIDLKGSFIENHTLSYFMLIAFAISILAVKASMIDRMYMYFWIFGIVYIPNVISNIKNKKEADFIKYCIVVLSFAYNMIILYYRPEWNTIVPFTFFWQ